MASGLILGLGFISGAVGVPIMGTIADHIGLSTALLIQVPVVVATIPVALFLPSESYLHRHGSARPETQAATAAAAGD